MTSFFLSNINLESYFTVGKLMTKCCSLTFRLGGGLLLHVCEDIPGKILSKYTSAEPI